MLLLISTSLFAEPIKIESEIFLGGQKQLTVKLVDLVQTHKVNQGLIPVFENLNILEQVKEGTFTLSRDELVNKLKQIKMDTPELADVSFILPAQLKVSHSGVRLNSRVIIENLKRLWSKKCSSCRTLVENINVPELGREYKNKQWTLNISDSVPRGRFSVQLIFPNVKNPGTVWVTGQAMTQKPVATVNRNVPKDQKIQVDWVTLAFKNIGSVDGAIVDLNALNNKVTSKYLMNGDIIKSRYLVSKVAFQRGDAVKLIIQEDNLSVATTAIAQSLGKVGHKVWVKSLNTNKRIAGVVNELGEVVVQ